MNVATHAFRDAFFFHKKPGFALVCDDDQSRAAVPVPFITQKHDPGHLRLFVFESADAAEEDKKRFPSHIRLAVQQVSREEVSAFAARGYFGVPAIVFLRDQSGDDAIL